VEPVAESSPGSAWTALQPWRSTVEHLMSHKRAQRSTVEHSSTQTPSVQQLNTCGLPGAFSVQRLNTSMAHKQGVWPYNEICKCSTVEQLVRRMLARPSWSKCFMSSIVDYLICTGSWPW